MAQMIECGRLPLGIVLAINECWLQHRFHVLISKGTGVCDLCTGIDLYNVSVCGLLI